MQSNKTNLSHKIPGRDKVGPQGIQRDIQWGQAFNLAFEVALREGEQLNDVFIKHQARRIFNLRQEIERQ